MSKITQFTLERIKFEKNEKKKLTLYQATASLKQMIIHVKSKRKRTQDIFKSFVIKFNAFLRAEEIKYTQ